MRLGAPILDKTKDPQELAKAHVALGYRAAFCPFGLSTDETPYLHDLRRAFEEHDVALAEVIAWHNLMPQDAAMRAAAFESVCGQLAVADELGACCCLTFGGSFENKKGWTPHPDNLSPAAFDRIVQTTRRIIDEVKPSRTKLALEMMPSVFPNSVDSYVALIKAVDRPAFGVHLDPVNIIISPQQYFDSTAVIRECFAKLGPWIASCHVKDLLWRVGRGYLLEEAIPGAGVIDIRTYLVEASRLSPDLPLMLEHLDSAEEYKQSYDYVRSVQASLDRA